MPLFKHGTVCGHINVVLAFDSKRTHQVVFQIHNVAKGIESGALSCMRHRVSRMGVMLFGPFRAAPHQKIGTD